MKIFLCSVLSLILLILVVKISRDDSWLIVACDVGQGDAYLVKKGRFQFLIDTGPSLEKLLICLEDNMPIFDKKIDVILITHADFDHYGGFVGLRDYYAITNLYHNVYDNKDDQRYTYFLDYLFNQSQNGRLKYSVVSNSTKLTYSDGNFTFAIADSGMILEDSELSDSNKQSVITIFKSSKNTALFTADSDYKLLSGLISYRYIPFDVSGVSMITVPHHGSKTGLSDDVINFLNPTYCVISVGKNSYGHPSSDTLSLLHKHKCITYNTFIDKSVKFKF